MELVLKQDFFSYLRTILHPYRVHLTAFTCALLVDTISTIHFMRDTGPQDEIHPIVRLAALIWGPITGPILAAIYKFIAAILMIQICKPLTCPVLTVSTILYLLAGVYNYFAIEMYTSGLIGWLPF